MLYQSIYILPTILSKYKISCILYPKFGWLAVSLPRNHCIKEYTYLYIMYPVKLRLDSWLYPTHYTVSELKMACITEWGDSHLIPFKGIYYSCTLKIKGTECVISSDPLSKAFITSDFKINLLFFYCFKSR